MLLFNVISIAMHEAMQNASRDTGENSSARSKEVKKFFLKMVGVIVVMQHIPDIFVIKCL